MNQYIKLEKKYRNYLTVFITSEWVLKNIDKILYEKNNLKINDKNIILELSELKDIDVSGAYILKNFIKELEHKDIHISFYGISEKELNLLELVDNNLKKSNFTSIDRKFLLFYRLGEHLHNLLNDIIFFLSFFGEICLTFGKILIKPKKIRWKEVFYEIENSGVYAVPIVSLVAVLSGIVISYQGAAQLSKFGANIFVVDLIGLSIAREMSPLLTSIMVAGRSGSSYTARIGSMMLNEEIDALRTIGISPIELLVIPKFFAMIICLPLLIFVADIIGIGGGLFISHILLNLNFHTLIFRLKSTLSITSFLIGILKGPIFAIPIVFISCFRGFHVKNSSEELGKYTTMSVVNTIFFVIILDAILSIIFQKIGI